MNSYWSRRLAHLVPYVPGEQPEEGSFIKLNTNENPYPPSPRVLEAITAAADGALRRYPKPECGDLRDAIAEFYGLGPEQVFVGNGSDEVLIGLPFPRSATASIRSTLICLRFLTMP